MILDMIQGCWYLRRSTDRWLLSKNSMTWLDGLESWHGAGWLWNCSMPITNTQGLYLYPISNTTPSRIRLQHWLPKTYNISSCWFRTHHQFISFFISSPRHHIFSNVSVFNYGTALCRMTTHSRPQNASYRMCWKATPTEWYYPANLGPHVSFCLYQFLVLTECVYS
jgi:hypothetical protein